MIEEFDDETAPRHSPGGRASVECDGRSQAGPSQSNAYSVGGSQSSQNSSMLAEHGVVGLMLSG